ncbi:hypothetical protein HK098_005378, partial [Nowakowskiella sp. JEL0407]
MGSDMLFGSFPSDINLRKIKTLVYAKFKTKGDHRQIFAQLAAWLQTNVKCTGTTENLVDCADDVVDLQVKYDSVISLGHSMGGIFAVDAYCAMAGLIGPDGKPLLRRDIKLAYEELLKPKDKKLKKVVLKYSKESDIKMNVDSHEIITENKSDSLKDKDDATAIQREDDKPFVPIQNQSASSSVAKVAGSVGTGTAWLGLSYVMGARSAAKQIVKETVIEVGKSTISATVNGARAL